MTISEDELLEFKTKDEIRVAIDQLTRLYHKYYSHEARQEIFYEIYQLKQLLEHFDEQHS